MKFQAHLNGRPVKNPVIRGLMGLVALGVAAAAVLLVLLVALPVALGVAIVGALVVGVGLPLLARFGKVSKLSRGASTPPVSGDAADRAKPVERIED